MSLSVFKHHAMKTGDPIETMGARSTELALTPWTRPDAVCNPE
jgi:hypothetical protein